MHWKKVFLLLLVLGCFLMPEAQAQKLVGDLVLKRGLVKVRRLGREYFFRTQGAVVPIFERDVVQTGPNTRVIISMRLKKEVVQMYSNSHIAIEQLKPTRTSIGMAIGKALFSLVRSLKIQPQFLVRTQSTSIGVKGTKFVVGNEEHKSYVLTLEGKVGVISKARPKVEVVLSKGQAIIGERGEALSEVVEVSEEQQQAIVKEEGLGTFKKLVIPEEMFDELFPYMDAL
ncbi:MAG: FecR family protein [SAR324 cluster bacterium]|nr:FecR family protein [SAR324 cluster bacterium]